MISSTATLGSHLLREIAADECSLEDILKALQKTKLPDPSRTGIEKLDGLFYDNPHTNAASNQKINISGRYLPLLYHLLNVLVSKEQGTVAVIDLEGRFSPSHLSLSPTELKHIHVFTPNASNLAVTLQSIESYFLYGNHQSYGRVFKGTFVIGGTGGDFNFGWRGSVRVEREEVGKFGEGGGVEEFWRERERREEVVGRKGWVVKADGREYRFNDEAEEKVVRLASESNSE